MVRGPSGVALLVAAYPSAGTNYSAQVLVGCLARAFPSLRAKTETDTDFVAACGRWLAENKARCVVNPTYMYAHAIGAPVVLSRVDIGFFEDPTRPAGRPVPYWLADEAEGWNHGIMEGGNGSQIYSDLLGFVQMWAT